MDPPNTSRYACTSVRYLLVTLIVIWHEAATFKVTVPSASKNPANHALDLFMQTAVKGLIFKAIQTSCNWASLFVCLASPRLAHAQRRGRRTLGV
jgi:hypothetical protein